MNLFILPPKPFRRKEIEDYFHIRYIKIVQTVSCDQIDAFTIIINFLYWSCYKLELQTARSSEVFLDHKVVMQKLHALVWLVRERTNHSSPYLWLMYFLNAITLSLPLIAYTDWIMDDIKMPLDKQNNYYACIFIPHGFKPIYAIISEKLPIFGSHRRIWLCISALGTAAMFAIQSFFVFSTAGAFASSFALQVCYSFSELLLGACLMDYAHKDLRNAGAVQAAATAARFSGSATATLLGFLLYPCEKENGSDPIFFDSRTLIALTALCPLLLAIISPLLPEKSKSSSIISPSRRGAADLAIPDTVTRDEDGAEELTRNLLLHEQRHQEQQIDETEESKAKGRKPLRESGGGKIAERSSPALRVNEVQEPGEFKKNENEGLESSNISSSSSSSKDAAAIGGTLRFYMSFALCEAVFVWVSLKVLYGTVPFYTTLSVLLLLAALSIAETGVHVRTGSGLFSSSPPSPCSCSSGDEDDDDARALVQPQPQPQPQPQQREEEREGEGEGEGEGKLPFWSIFGPALFLFLSNATPNTIYQYQSFQFALFVASPCQLVMLSLFAESQALLASICYGIFANQRHVRSAIAVSTVCKCAVALLVFPLLEVEPDSDDVHTITPLGGLLGDITVFHYALLYTGIVGFVNQVAFIPLQVLATESSPKSYRVVAYAAYLSILDTGDTVSDWITSPLVSYFGITYDNYEGLSSLTLVQIVSSLIVLGFLPFLVPPTQSFTSIEQEQEQEQEQEKEEEEEGEGCIEREIDRSEGEGGPSGSQMAQRGYLL